MTLLTSDEIYTLLDSQGAPGLLTDETYCFPTRESYLELAGAAFGNLGKLGLIGYEPEAWDCENFAFLSRSLMWASHVKTPGHPKASLAIGVYCYQPDGSPNGHAINCGLIKENGKMALVWSEPQSGREVKLTKTEQNSCMGIWI